MSTESSFEDIIIQYVDVVSLYERINNPIFKRIIDRDVEGYLKEDTYKYLKISKSTYYRYIKKIKNILKILQKKWN